MPRFAWCAPEDSICIEDKDDGAQNRDTGARQIRKLFFFRMRVVLCDDPTYFLTLPYVFLYSFYMGSETYYFVSDFLLEICYLIVRVSLQGPLSMDGPAGPRRVCSKGGYCSCAWGSYGGDTRADCD